MEEIRLDAPQEAGRARFFAVQINGPAELLLEKKLEVHEAGEGGGSGKIDEKIEIMGWGFTPRGGSKEPQFFDPERTKFRFKIPNGRKQCEGGIHGRGGRVEGGEDLRPET
jgi:hypothetical protein